MFLKHLTDTKQVDEHNSDLSVLTFYMANLVTTFQQLDYWQWQKGTQGIPEEVSGWGAVDGAAWTR